MISKTKRKIGIIVVMVALMAGIITFNSSTVNAGLAEDKKAAQEKVDSFKAQMDSANGNLNAIYDAVKAMEDEIAALEVKLQAIAAEQIVLEKTIADKEVEVAKAEKEFDKNKEGVYNRAREVYEDGEVDYTEVILESKDLTSFLNNSEYYRIFKEKENEKVEEVKKERDQLEIQKQELLAKKTDLENNKLAAEQEKINKDASIAAMESQKVAIEAAKAEIQSALSAEQATLASIQDQINSSLINSGGPGEYTGNGIFAWPVPGCTTISSPFGPRWGTMHGGIDIANGNAFGLTIVAADSGVVVMASSGGYGGGFGNFVVINHGGGILTLYGHMNGVNVSAGQSVSRGQAIGTVGNTGQSFGAHLHFQVTNNGNIYSPVNPMQYL